MVLATITWTRLQELTTRNLSVSIICWSLPFVTVMIDILMICFFGWTLIWHVQGVLFSKCRWIFLQGGVWLCGCGFRQLQSSSVQLQWNIFYKCTTCWHEMYLHCNAGGRLIGTLLSGFLYTYAGSTIVSGFGYCFVASVVFAALSSVLTLPIKDNIGGLACGSCLQFGAVSE